MNKQQQVIQSYEQQFGRAPEIVVRACGRINLLGEHVDYNDGFVLPAAIDKYIYFALGKRRDEHYDWYALDLDDRFEVTPDHLERGEKGWANYLMGILDQFQKAGKSVPGMNCAFGGNLPIGAGLSSSAAIEGGFGLGINELFNVGYTKTELAALGQRAEQQFVGMPCGIMDQFSSLMGKEGQVIQLDCRSMDYAYFPFQSDQYVLLLVNSHVSHALTDSGYPQRVKESLAGLRVLQNKFQGVSSFRDVTAEMLSAIKPVVEDEIYRRCDYIIQEIRRVPEASAALQANDFKRLGELMFETHAGLRDDYEVSCSEIDFLVDFAAQQQEVVGSRMMGGGFGGCTINLVEKQHLELFRVKVRMAYQKQFGIFPDTYEVNIVEGTSVVQ